MVIDTSAIIAILLDEPTVGRIADAIASASVRLLSATNLVEASIAVERRTGDSGGRELDLLIYWTGIEIVPVDQDQAELARVAWRRFGKGRDRAGLNYGDCFAYALAKSRRVPLLFVGNDFSYTDVEPALA